MGTRRIAGTAAWRGAVLGIVLALGTVADAGSPVVWNGGTGVWDNPGGWDLGVVPNNGGSTYDVSIAQPADDVSLNLSATVDTVANAGTLRLLGGYALTLAQPGGLNNTGYLSINHTGVSSLYGTVNNSGFAWVESGTLQLNDTATHTLQNSGTIWLGNGSYAGGTTVLRPLSDLTLNGTGELYFYSAASTLANQPLLDVAAGVTLTNAVDHRIHGGAGRISGAGTFVNQGLLDADTPLRTLTVSPAQFTNQGNLFARSGNLNVTVDRWHNYGSVLVANNSRSTFTGTLITNETAASIRAIGGGQLTLAQGLTNAGTVATAGGGKVTFAAGSALVTNLPSGVIDATVGTVRFEAANGYVQNFGTLRADQSGHLEFANGADVFGGYLTLSNSSDAKITAGTTTLTNVRTTLDATSTLAALDTGTGAATLTFDGMLTNNGGTLKAQSDTVGTATFNLSGNTVDAGGTILANGGYFNISNGFWQETGTPTLDIRNGGRITFTNESSTAGQMNVAWTGAGGQLNFNGYQTVAGYAAVSKPQYGPITYGPTPRTAAPTALDLSGWTATGGTFTVSGGSVLSGFGLAALPIGTQMSVTGAGSRLTLTGMSATGTGSAITLSTGGRLTATPGLTINGAFNFQGGTFDGSLALNPSATFAVTAGTNQLNGDLSWVGNRTVNIASGSTLGVSGTIPVAAGSTMQLTGNSSRLQGTGLLANAGLLAGGAPSAGNSTFSDIDIVNQSGGVVRAYQNGAATGTYFQLTNDITNHAGGLMEADGAYLYFNGARVTNSGTLQAVNHAAGSKLMFLNAATVADLGGTTLVDGAASRVEVSGGANVNLGTLTFANGGTGSVTGANSVLAATNNFTILPGTAFSLTSSGKLAAPGVTLNGQLVVQSSSTVDAPVTVNPTGQILASSGTGTLLQAVNVQNDGLGGLGRISLTGNAATLNGAGLITNSGLIEGGAPSTGNSTYLDNPLVNNAEGVVRAYQNGTATNTYFRLSGDITNAGVLEANGGSLYLTTVNGTNSGTFRAVNHAAGSKLTFADATVIANAGGSATVDGELSTLEVLGGSQVTLSTLSLTNNADLTVSDSGSRLTVNSPVAVGQGSVLELKTYGTFSPTALTLGGQLNASGGTTTTPTVLTAPVSVTTTGRITQTSGALRLSANGSTTAAGAIVDVSGYDTRFTLDGTLSNYGLMKVTTTSSVGARFDGSGTLTNHGVIEGSNTYANSYTAYLDTALVNAADGTVRAVKSGTRTGSNFQFKAVTNDGLMEANGANLSFNAATVVNNGTLRTVEHADGSKILFAGGTTMTGSGSVLVDGAHGDFQASGASNVGIGTWSFTNSAVGTITDANTVVTVGSGNIADGSRLTLQSSGRLAGGTVQTDGELFASGSATISAPVTLGPLGEFRLTSGTVYVNGTLTAQNSGGINRGTVSILANSGTFDGTGTLVNSGLLQGGAPTNNNTTYWNNPLVNNADGIVRAFKNGTATGTTLRLNDTVTNAGLMEGDAATLSFDGAGALVTNSGTIQAVNGGGFLFTNGARVTDAGGVLAVTAGSTGTLNGTATTVGAANVTVDGDLYVRNPAVLNAPVTVNSGGRLHGTSTINGAVSIAGGGQLIVDRFDSVVANGKLTGTGLITNHGTLIGQAGYSGGYQAYLDKELLNASDGVVRAARAGTNNNTYFEFSKAVTNYGMMEADGANLQFSTGATVNNAGTIRAVDHANGSKLIFTNNAVVNNLGGGAAVADGALSTFQVTGGANVAFDTLTLSNGATGWVDTANSRVTAATTVNSGTTFRVESSGRLSGPSALVNGTLYVRNSGVVDAPLTIGSGGQLINDGATGTLNAPTEVAAGGTLSLLSNATRVNGTGLITNHGTLRSGSTSNSGTNYLDSAVTNAADGLIRAYQNGTATNTNFRLTGDITNQGVLEADGGNLYFDGADVQHGGLLRAVSHAGGSKVIFANSSTMTDLGGTATIDGAGSELQVSGASQLALNAVTFSNGATGYVSDANSRLTTDLTVDAGATFSVRAGAQLGGSAQINGEMYLTYSTLIDGPVTVGNGGLFRTSTDGGYTNTINAPVTVANGGTVDLRNYANTITGTGTFTNHGTIKGGPGSNSQNVYLTNTLVNETDGVVRAYKNGTATNTTFVLTGDVTNRGLLQADASTLKFDGIFLDNTAGTWSAVNGGRLLLNNTFVTGASGSNTTVDGTGSSLDVTGGSLAALDTLTLTNGGSVNVSGTNSTLYLFSPFTVPASSTATVSSSGRLNAPSFTVAGDLSVGAATIDAPITITPTGDFFATSGTAAWLEQDVVIQNDGGGNYGKMTLQVNGALIDGTGRITNHGLIQGGAPSNNNWTYLYNAVTNAADGTIRAFKNGTATGTSFRLNDAIDNSGIMEADGATLDLYGATVTNRGVMRALNAGSLNFNNAAKAINGGGTISIASGSTGTVNGSGTIVDSSAFQVGGQLFVQNSGVVNAPLSVASGGTLTANSGTATHNGAVTVDVGGLLEVQGYANRMNGTGLITNAGTIRGSQNTYTNGALYLDNDIVNNAGGLIRAYKSGTVNGSSFYLGGDIANAGVMEADGGNLVFATAGQALQNSGILRAVDHANGSKLIFSAAMTATSAGGGTTTLNGALSELQVSGGAVTDLGALSFTNGATGYVSGTNSRVTANLTLNGGSTFRVESSGRLSGASAAVDGTLYVRSGGVVDAPLTLGATSQLINDSGTGTLNAAAGVANGGTVSILGNSVRINGTGTITNSGLIRAGAISNNNTTYLDNPLVNDASGVVRAFQNGTATNTNFQFGGNVTNNGIMEASGGNLLLTSGASVQNAGTLRAVSHAAGSKVLLTNAAAVNDVGGTGAAMVDGATSRLEVQSAATATFNSVQISNGGTVLVTGNGSRLTGGFTVNAGTNLQVQSAGQVVVGGGGMSNSGTVSVSGASTFTANGPVTTTSGSTLSFTAGNTLDFNASLAVGGIFDMASNTADVDGLLSFGSDGRLRATTGGRFKLADDYTLISTQRIDFDSKDITLELDAGLNAVDPLLMEVGSSNVGAVLAGLTDNFGWGTLLISGTDEFVKLVDLADNAGDGATLDALYVSTLTLTDLDSRLILNGITVYYGTFNGDVSQIDTSLGGSFLPIGSFLPEPASLLLLALGGVVVLRRHRSR